MSYSLIPFARLLHIQERGTRHSTSCCALTATWLQTIDQIQCRGADPLVAPHWIAHRWTWGWSTPSLPICVAVRRTELACGSLAAIAWEVAKTRGLQAARLQTIVAYNSQEMTSYADRWQERFDTAGGWIQGCYAYHVVVLASLEHDIALIWDPTSGVVQNVSDEWEAGRILAMKIVPDEGIDSEYALSRLKLVAHTSTRGRCDVVNGWLVSL